MAFRALHGLPPTGVANARLSCGAHNRSDDRDGVAPRPCHETTRNSCVSFGKLDRTDFFIPPFALFYIYLVLAAAFGLPLPSAQEFFHSKVVSWVGISLCAAGLILLPWSIISFGRSFRVGIDITKPDELVTTGAFAISRNPIYVAFALILIGQFLVFPNWILLAYLITAVWLFNRQVLREEAYLKSHYGSSYEAYSRKVRRYL
jgi:protein-S-isoprenylcysteine O-methyltransferase Ste14